MEPGCWIPGSKNPIDLDPESDIHRIYSPTYIDSNNIGRINVDILDPGLKDPVDQGSGIHADHGGTLDHYLGPSFDGLGHH